VSLLLDGPGSSRHQTLDHLYYNGGGHFILPEPKPSYLEVVARYVDQESTENRIAAVLSRKGKGKALLCSVHFEYPLTSSPAKDAITRFNPSSGDEDVERSEKARIEWMEDLLIALGLRPPGRGKEGEIRVEGEEDPGLLLHPTHPSPVFLFSHPSLPELAKQGLRAKALQNKLVKEGDASILRDGNDELRFVDVSTLATESGPSDITKYLAKRRRDQPVLEPTIEKLSLESADTPAPPQAPDFHSIPKTILLPSQSLTYSPSWTPLFNIDTYWAELDKARQKSGRKSGVMRRDGQGERAAVGDLLWYGETVTSTQTMIDR
jgi:biotin--protein ligase